MLHELCKTGGGAIRVLLSTLAFAGGWFYKLKIPELNKKTMYGPRLWRLPRCRAKRFDSLGSDITGTVRVNGVKYFAILVVCEAKPEALQGNLEFCGLHEPVAALVNGRKGRLYTLEHAVKNLAAGADGVGDLHANVCVYTATALLAGLLQLNEGLFVAVNSRPSAASRACCLLEFVSFYLKLVENNVGDGLDANIIAGCGSPNSQHGCRFEQSKQLDQCCTATLRVLQDNFCTFALVVRSARVHTMTAFGFIFLHQAHVSGAVDNVGEFELNAAERVGHVDSFGLWRRWGQIRSLYHLVADAKNRQTWNLMKTHVEVAFQVLHN